MEAIVSPAHIEPGRYNAEYVRRRSALLDTPQEREALTHLLDDVKPWCRVGPRASGDTGTVIAGRDVAFRVIGDFPIEGMRGTLEALRDREAGAVEDGLRPADVLRAYDYVSKHAPSADGARVDVVAADATPRAFEGVIELAATQTAVNPEVSEHIENALLWLRTLAALSNEDRRDCVAAIRPALTDGPLGKLMIDKFDKLTASQRLRVLEIFIIATPAVAEGWVRGVAVHDPDEKVRDEADALVQFLARRAAGSSARP